MTADRMAESFGANRGEFLDDVRPPIGAKWGKDRSVTFMAYGPKESD